MKEPGTALRRDGAAQRSAKARRGFTLIEVVLVVAILAMLGALIAPSLSSWRGEAELSGAADEVEAAVARARSLSQRDGMPRRIALVEAKEGFYELTAWAVRPESLELGGESRVEGGVVERSSAGESFGAGEGSEGVGEGGEAEPSAPGRVLAELPRGVVASVRLPTLGGSVYGVEETPTGIGGVLDEPDSSGAEGAASGGSKGVAKPGRVIVLGLMLPDGTFSRAGESVYLVQGDRAGGARRAIRIEVSSWTGEARRTEVRLEEASTGDQSELGGVESPAESDGVGSSGEAAR